MHSELGVIEDLSYVDEIVEEFGRGSEAVIPILQEIQEHYRYLPTEALERVCEITDITPAQITGVATFYSQFRHRPMGQHMISLCDGTACHVKGSGNIENELCSLLDVPVGGGTTHDLLFTVETVACVGACALAPVVVVNGEVQAEQSVSSVTERAERLREQSEKAREVAETEATGA